MCLVRPHALCEARDRTTLHLWCVLRVHESGTVVGRSLKFCHRQTLLTVPNLDHLAQMLPCFYLESGLRRLDSLNL